MTEDAKPVLMAPSAQAFQLWNSELAREMADSDSALRAEIKKELPRSVASVYAVASFMAAWGTNGANSFAGERMLEEALGMTRKSIRIARRVLILSGWLVITGTKKGPNGESNVYQISIPANRWEDGWAKYKAQGVPAPTIATEPPKKASKPPVRVPQSARVRSVPEDRAHCPACEKGQQQSGAEHMSGCWLYCNPANDPLCGTWP
ncbi:hypothetical protein [Actinomadura xylanilytica]|uniref:hypothetical protein n=1 Tax=Actinomadura xylanilytica TaxID=887459 RepID=UPI00255B237B|nr:hypothetical protein [Actinomadura xylanilytica]MDL4771638.1 hypothetical protein [Actinomadura xylanilytica]